MESAGRYLDGISARPLPVMLRLADGRLSVLGEGLTRDWEYGDLRADGPDDPIMRVGPVHTGERIEISDPDLIKAITALAPDLYAKPKGPRPYRVVAFAAMVGAVTLGTAIFGMPLLADLLAPMVPAAAERRVGILVEDQIRRIVRLPRACEDSAGRAALDRMVAALIRAHGLQGSEPLRADIHVSVYESTTANAMALPGGRIIVLSSLIDRAKEPNELAAVIAHELGHVSRRDPTRLTIQASGRTYLLSHLIGDFTGSILILTLANQLIAASYGREAERAADAFAVGTMVRVGADGAALATFLERIAEDKDAAMVFLRNHPLTSERAAAIRAQASEAPIKAPIIDDNAWADLKGLCSTEDDE